MSTHRELQNAQAALNEAVALMLAARAHGHDLNNEDAFEDALLDVNGCYIEWNTLRMQFDGDRPAVARDTSIAAAKTKPLMAGSLRRRVVEAVVAHWKLYGTGLTTDELEVRFKRTHQSVSSAVSDMDRKGWIVDSDERRVTRSGCKAIVWKPSSWAAEMIEGEH